MNGQTQTQQQTQHLLKKQAAQAAMDMIAPALQPDTVLGIGTGSTVDAFIDLLAAQCKGRFRAAVSSSERSSQRLQAHGIAVLNLNELPVDPASGYTAPLPFYVDGADEIDDRLRMIKGGGGALTREKIVASAARQFICVVDASKRVAQLGAFPLPLEVLPLAQTVVAQRLTQQGARVVVRKAGNNNAEQNLVTDFVADFVTDNGGLILDVSGLDMSAPERLESELNNLPGVLTCGLFALRRADVALIARPQGVDQLHA